MEELESQQPAETAAHENEVQETPVAETEAPAIEGEPEQLELPENDAPLRAVLEAIVYITDEPLTLQQISAAIQQPIDRVKRALDALVAEYDKAEHGLSIREIAGGYKMSTKAEHHEAVRAFVKKLTPPLKLSLAALETLAVIAYKQPVTAPEIMDIRGVQGAGVLKTLLDRKLIQESGRKKVIGQPILYKTTKDFLVQFGLASVSELPTLKEFEELGRMELVEEIAEGAEAAADVTPEAPEVTGLIEHDEAQPEVEAPETAPTPEAEPVEETETVAGAEPEAAEEAAEETAESSEETKADNA